MSTLNGYIILHGNLGFSSIPKDHYGIVLDHCYWPMLELIQNGCPMGIEFPGETLLILEKLDQTFIKTLKKCWAEGLCDFIGSSFTQNTLPLNPYILNMHNLQEGLAVYEALLGRRPQLAFLPEMTFSQSLPEMVKQVGYKAIVMDWDNASEHNSYPQEMRYQPALCQAGRSTLPLIWNSSMNSYKFQRYIYGRISLKDFVSGIRDHRKTGHVRALPLYGTDWEIFDYRPVNGKTATGEIARVKTVFEALHQKNGVEMCLPSQVLKRIPPTDVLPIASPEIPIPCKNRDDYNVARWSVSGRDDVSLNTRCFDLYRKTCAAASLKPEAVNSDIWRSLVSLWGSDYRTKTTDEKYYSFWKDLGHLESRVDHILKPWTPVRERPGTKLTIGNLGPYDWKDEILETTLHFKPGQMKGLAGLEVEGQVVPSQCENMEYYRDGSLRRVLFLFAISLKSGVTKQGKLFHLKDTHEGIYTIRLNGPMIDVSTPQVSFRSSTRHGGDIHELSFKSITDTPLIKYLPPVFFDSIAYSNDYFSGWNECCTEDGMLHFDTRLSSFKPDPHHYTLRVPLHFEHPFLDGMIYKRYDIYLHQPRVDLTVRFHLQNINPVFLRTAITTLNPEVFKQAGLQYSTINGGTKPESFPLKGHLVRHTRAPSKSCSATSCLGATEGWVAVHDDEKGLAMISPRSSYYSAPLLDYEEVQRRYLLRLYHSICETDDTGKILIRGHNVIRFSYLGFKKQLQPVQKLAHLVNHPPLLSQTD